MEKALSSSPEGLSDVPVYFVREVRYTIFIEESIRCCFFGFYLEM